MSHRKFSAPRHGSLAFLPKKRAARHRGKVKAFPQDDPSQECALTSFIGYKAGMTHILRELTRPGSKAHKKEIVEAVTIIDCPPMVAVGYVGYQKTLRGLKAVGTVWGTKLHEEFRRRHYKCWKNGKNKKAFTNQRSEEDRDVATKRIVEHSDVIRLICHTRMMQNLKQLRQKKAHIMEIQVNGGSIEDKVNFCKSKLEQEIRVNEVYSTNDMTDTIAVTKGRGTEGVITRWGITRLPRKTHRGLRKVACIGSWHPARVSYTVARVGQNGYHHRTETNKKIYLVGVNEDECRKAGNFQAKTETDLTDKMITPMGGFVRYGRVKNDFIMIKGSCPGPVKRPITLRQPLNCPTNSVAKENVVLKWIDTSSKFGHGRFQTVEERKAFTGMLKRDRKAEEANQ